MNNRIHKIIAAAAFAGLLYLTPLVWLAADADDQYSEWGAPANLGPIVNSPFADSEPFISKDGLSLYFNAGNNRKPNFGRNDIWVAQRPSKDEPWGPPQNLGPVINTTGFDQGPALTIDGHLLFFSSSRSDMGFGGRDIYVSRRHNKRDDFGWETPENLGSGVNTCADELDPAFFEDDETGIIYLYFASNRSGGCPVSDTATPANLDNLDIYVSVLQQDGTFGPAEPVHELNSPFPIRERHPAIRRDGLEMYLASNRPGTFGNFDIWVSTRASTADPWSEPVHLGLGINSPPRDPSLEQANDEGPALSFDGTELYFHSAFRPENVNFGPFDLWVATRTKLKQPE